MFVKRFKFAIRDKRSLFCEVIIPILFVCYSCYITDIFSKKNDPAITFTDDFITDPITIPWASGPGVDASSLEELFTEPVYKLEKYQD